jgi:hypothetical protein
MKLKPIKWRQINEYNWSAGKNILIRKCPSYFRAYFKAHNKFSSSPKLATFEFAKEWCQKQIQKRYNELQKEIQEIESEIGIEETEYVKWCKKQMEEMKVPFERLDPTREEAESE